MATIKKVRSEEKSKGYRRRRRRRKDEQAGCGCRYLFTVRRRRLVAYMVLMTQSSTINDLTLPHEWRFQFHGLALQWLNLLVTLFQPSGLEKKNTKQTPKSFPRGNEIREDEEDERKKSSQFRTRARRAWSSIYASSHTSVLINRSVVVLSSVLNLEVFLSVGPSLRHSFAVAKWPDLLNFHTHWHTHWHKHQTAESQSAGEFR